MSTEQRDALPTLVQRFLAEDFARWGHDQRCSKPTAKELADTQTALREYLSIDFREMPPIPNDKLLALSIEQGWKIHTLQQGMQRVATNLHVDSELLVWPIDDWDALIDATIAASRLGAVREDAQNLFAIRQRTGIVEPYLYGTFEQAEEKRKELDRLWSHELNGPHEVVLLYAHTVARVPEPATGAELIAAERQRQVRAEGWSASHDDSHSHGELAISAACYAAHGTDAEVSMHGEDAMPWGSCDDKRRKHDRVRQLTIAGALIAAEIDRLLRWKSQPSLLVETTDTPEKKP